MTLQSPEDLQSPPRDESAVTHEIVKRVSDASGVDPLELPPLYRVIDPDALGAVTEGSADASEVRVSFTYEGYRVTVTGAGDVTVERHR